MPFTDVIAEKGNSPERPDWLVSPLAGLIGRVVKLTASPGEPCFPTYSAQLGDLSRILPAFRYEKNSQLQSGEMDGAGGDLNDDIAMRRAIAESLERYSSCIYVADQFIWATGHELGSDALDLDCVPRCSASELAHPLCPLRAPDKAAPIRWVRGVSLMTHRSIWIPAIMVYLHIPWLSIGERFALPISTGCAAHPSLAQALINALCEVIERDAISLIWLQQLALPRIVDVAAIPKLGPYLKRYEPTHITPYFFDATTDLGIPTVYSVELAPYDANVATLVMCATDLDPARAIAKVIREAAASRIAMHAPHELPPNPDLFAGVFHGATYMGVPERQSAFRFLLDSPASRQGSDLASLERGDTAANLSFLLERLRSRDMEAFAVDLTTDEALYAGMRVVRVIVPKLQPLTFSLRARYLALPRLYEAPLAMGYPARSEDQLNSWPQPFA